MNETADDQRLTLPDKTTPTWEMELLISAASTFALLQLLGEQQDAFLKLSVWFNESHMLALLAPLYIYTRIVLICLSGAFILHLASRAYWVGLIGLHSIFPEGPDLRKFRYGPFQRKVLDANKPDIDRLIGKADDRASMVFGFGVGLALLMVVPILLMAVVLALAWATSPLFGFKNATLIALLGVVSPFVVFAALPSLIDQLAGKYIPPDSVAGRALSKCFIWLNRLSINSSGNALTMYLFSRMKGVKTVAAASALFGCILSLIALIGIPELSKVASLNKAASGLDASDYTSQRNGNLEYANRAFIAAPVVSGRYLDLTVPVPAHDIPSGNAKCLQAKNEKQRMFCLRETIRLQMDGKPLAASWMIQNPSSGKTRALRSFIDISALPPGEHVLQIDYSENPSAPDEALREIIRFWK